MPASPWPFRVPAGEGGRRSRDGVGGRARDPPSGSDRGHPPTPASVTAPRSPLTLSAAQRAEGVPTHGRTSEDARGQRRPADSTGFADSAGFVASTKPADSAALHAPPRPGPADHPSGQAPCTGAQRGPSPTDRGPLPRRSPSPAPARWRGAPRSGRMRVRPSSTKDQRPAEAPLLLPPAGPGSRAVLRRGPILTSQGVLEDRHGYLFIYFLVEKLSKVLLPKSVS